MTGFQEITIGELGKIITGSTPPTKERKFYGEEYQFIKPTDIQKENRSIFDTETKLSQIGLDWFGVRILPPNTICVVCIGTIGKLCLTTETCATNQQINSIVVDTSQHDPFFVFYLMRMTHPKIKKLEGGSASGREHVNKTNFSGIKVRVPPLETQQRIGAILSTYDDLIENNSRRIADLEAAAQTLYREWFIEFRFPRHESAAWVESELGVIPQGWEVGCVKDFGKVVTGKTPSTRIEDNFGDFMPFIKTPDMHGNMFVLQTQDSLSEKGVLSQSTKTLPLDTLLVNCIGALAGSVSITTDNSQTNQQINAVILDRLTYREFLYFVLIHLKPSIHLHGATGATMINLSKGKFESLPVVIPSDEILQSFHFLIAASFNQIRNLQQKNIMLQEARDLLLPRLISGELDVSEVEMPYNNE